MGFFSSLGIKNSNQNDFLNYSDDELYNQFKSENWEKLTNDNDKLALLQEIENRDAKEMQRPPATVIWEPRDSERLGGWNCRGNIISIKIDDNQYEMLDSLKHEGEHAVQDYSPSSSSKISKEDKDLMNVENEISINGKDIHYRYYDDDLYDLMTSELDSNSKAFLFMSSQQDRFKSDEKFLEYVQGRKEHFEEVADKIDQLQLEKEKRYLLLLIIIKSYLIQHHQSE